MVARPLVFDALGVRRDLAPPGPSSAGRARASTESPPRRRWHLRLPAAAAAVYLVAPLTAAVAVLSASSAGTFIAAGDIGPFFREGLRGDVGRVWGYGLTGSGSATVEVARLFELAAVDVTRLFGGSEIVAQRVFLWFWLAAASTGCIALARQIVRRPAAVATVGVLAIANPVMAVNLPNPLVPAAVATTTLVVAALVRARRGEGSVAVTVGATLPAAYLVINPPTLAVVFVSVAAFAVLALALPPRKALAVHLAKAIPVAVVAHLWWLVPAAIVFGTGRGAAVAAVTDAEAWAWTHVNNSVPNVVSLTAHWGWGLHEYLPFSRALDRAPLSWTRWGLPVLVVLAPVVAVDRRRRRLALGLVAVAAGAVFVGKGLHAPFAGVNSFLYRYVPGMWLLREPMSKVGPALIVAYLLAAAVTVDALVARARRGVPRRASSMSMAAAVVLVAGAVAFGHPVLTGDFAPTNRTPLPSSRVEVPDGWHDLAAYVNGDALEGKALVLPSLSFYQATTTWGYHGVATLPRDLLRRPTLLGLPGGYFADPDVVSGLVDVVAGSADPAVVRRALSALGVSHVIVRTDFADDQAVGAVAGGDQIAERLHRTGVFAEHHDFGVATVLRVGEIAPDVSVYQRFATVVAEGPDGTARAVSSLPVDVAALDDAESADGPFLAVDTTHDRVEASFRAPEQGSYWISADAPGAVHAAVRVGARGVVVDPGVRLSVDGDVIASVPPVLVPVPASSWPFAVVVDNQPVLLDDVEVGIDINEGSRLQVLGATGEERLITDWSEVGDCNAVDDREPQLRAEADARSVELAADAHAACVSAPTGVTGEVLLRFAVEVRDGSTGRLCVHDDAVDECVWSQEVASEPGRWTDVAAIVDLPRRSRVFLYADAGSGPTEVAYRDVRVTPTVRGRTVTMPTTDASASVDVVRGMHQVAVERLAAPSRVVATSGVSNCHARGEATLVDASFSRGVVTLQANGDAACVAYELGGFTTGIPYEVAVPFRTASPRPARWCLWLDGPDRCANEEQLLGTSPSWTTARHIVTIPSGVDRARVFVYADGGAGEGGLTVTQYRRPMVRAVSPVTIDAQPAAADASSRRATAVAVVEASGEGGRSMRLQGTGRPFVVALRDVADDGWKLEGLPRGATATPVAVDGYRQGWIVRGLAGEATIRATYSLESWASIARLVSLAAIVGLVAVGIRRPVREVTRRMMFRDAHDAQP